MAMVVTPAAPTPPGGIFIMVVYEAYLGLKDLWGHPCPTGGGGLYNLTPLQHVFVWSSVENGVSRSVNPGECDESVAIM